VAITVACPAEAAATLGVPVGVQAAGPVLRNQMTTPSSCIAPIGPSLVTDNFEAVHGGAPVCGRGSGSGLGSSESTREGVAGSSTQGTTGTAFAFVATGAVELVQPATTRVRVTIATTPSLRTVWIYTTDHLRRGVR
jgi:hypothetical protein